MLDLAGLRRLVIVSMFADDELMLRLVLKGGNALSLVHGIGRRSSLDLDFSIEDDFVDPNETGRRLLRSLSDRFDSAGFLVFDGQLISKPASPRDQPKDWGGYSLEFKVIRKELAARLGRVEDLRRQAQVTGPAQQRILRVEISKHELCSEKTEVELDGYTIFVYPPELIAVEKLRAICQQMPEYPFVRNKRARARDFYDIYCICTERSIALGSKYCRHLVERVFAAKHVPLTLLPRLSNHRDFHRLDWPSVIDSVAGKLAEFDFYFDWLVAETLKLESLWEK